MTIKLLRTTALGCFLSLSASAAEYTWVNTGTATWSDVTSWSPNAPAGGPTAADSVTLLNGITLTPTTLVGGGSVSAASIVRAGTGVSWYIGGGGDTLSTLNAGLIDHAASAGGSTTIIRNQTAAGLQVNATNVSVASGNLYFGQQSNSNTFYLSGLTVSGTATVTGGDLLFNIQNANSNAFSIGVLEVNAGTVTLANRPKAGSTETNLTVNGLTGTGGIIQAGTGSNNNGNQDANLVIDISENFTSGSVLRNHSTSHVNPGILSVVKSGSGTQTLTGANTYTGLTTINDGALSIGAGSTTGSLASNVVMTSTTASLVINRSNAYTHSGTISGIGSLVKKGSGTTTLSASNSHSGGTFIEGGTLLVASDDKLGASSQAVTIRNNAALMVSSGTETFERSVVLDNGGSLNTAGNTFATWSGTISGNGGLTKGGSGAGSSILYLIGNNTYTGDTTITAGAIRVHVTENLGDASNAVIFNSGTLARLEFEENEAVFNRSIMIVSGTATLSPRGTNTVEWSGEISGVGGVNKTFTGTLVLSGANTYQGDTTITTGAIVAANTAGSATGTGQVFVNPDRLLGGNGIIAPAAGNSVYVSGIISPGIDNAGTLTFNFLEGSSLNFSMGSRLDMTLGTVSDLVAFASAGDWLFGADSLTLNLTLGDGFSYANTYTIFSNVTTDDFTLAGITGYDSDAFTASFGRVGNDYVLSFTAVPEPSAVLLLGLGLGAIAWRRVGRKASR